MPIPYEEHGDWGKDRAERHEFADEVSRIPLLGGFLRAGLRPYDALGGGQVCATCGRRREDEIHRPAEPEDERRHWG